MNMILTPEFVKRKTELYNEKMSRIKDIESRKIYEGNINELEPNQIFVFGANLEGRHGKGSALIARQRFGAIYGQAEGLQGQSYGIVTKDLTKKIHPSISKERIMEQIDKLYEFARNNMDKEFFVAYSGTGKNLNSYSSNEMAMMFKRNDIPNNIIFEKEFYKLIYYNELNFR